MKSISDDLLELTAVPAMATKAEIGVGVRLTVIERRRGKIRMAFVRGGGEHWRGRKRRGWRVREGISSGLSSIRSFNI